MEIKKCTFDYLPGLVEYEGNVVRINFDVEQIELANNMDSKAGKKASRKAYAAHVVRISQPVSRDKVIDAIISEAYPTDKMQAIINNHFVNLGVIADGGTLKDADELAHEEEYVAMQEWRKKAKSVASDVMAELFNR